VRAVPFQKIKNRHQPQPPGSRSNGGSAVNDCTGILAISDSAESAQCDKLYVTKSDIFCKPDRLYSAIKIKAWRECSNSVKKVMGSAWVNLQGGDRRFLGI